MENMSSSPCVGCSCIPSPALMTDDFMFFVRNKGTPDALCLITTMSICMASIVARVSRSVSPLTTELVLIWMFKTSALRRFAASSNDVLVRVEGSKNMFTIVLPFNVGTFFIGLKITCLKDCARFRISCMSSLGSS
ncbi:MAG: hypothetical protein BWY84_00847 [Candidatus Aerophobetes bacterium ADurb.Bin490]|nr:MAG: hypothetical protein BWY84_00847 [Candidatus Aerophobetes bacterium ADurb.Bin490]